MAKSGVYQIVNQVNGKRYIGSSVDIKKRWRQHKYQLRKGCHFNVHLQRSWSKHNKSNFIFEIILLCPTNNILENEQLFINKLSPEYNIALDARSPMRGRSQSKAAKKKLSVANSGSNNPYYGMRHSKEVRLKISEANKGRKLSKEHCRKMSDARKGIKRSNKTKAKISRALSGHSVSEETKQKISEAHKGMPGYWDGKHRSAQTKQKISAANKGKTPWNKDKSPSDKTKKKISDSLKGKHTGKSRYNWIDIPDSDIRNMIALNNSGHSYVDIGKRYGISRDTVCRRIKSFQES